MSISTVGLLVILFVFLLMFFRIPIAIAMAIPASIGILYLRGWETLFSALDTIVWTHSYSYTLTTIPLFVLMGQLIYSSGISNELYTTFRNWLSGFRGGLGMATIGSSAMFAAASGSSLATTGTIGVMASKEMLAAGYSKSLTGGSIAAGGTLGILIPPSTMFIIYGMMTEQSIGKLLMAGILPGILLTLFFMITIYVSSIIKPDLIAKSTEEKVTWKERFTSLKSTIWIFLLFMIVIGGMYLGIFTATEAAGAGALGAFLIGLVRRKLTLAKINEAIFETIKTTGFIFAIVIGAFVLNYVLTITRVPHLISDFLFSTNLSPTMLFLIIVLMYIILGAVMDTLSMVVVTIPIIMPLLEAVGFDLIWFGVIIVLVVEMGLITPPVGMNCFVLNGVVKELELTQIFKGSLIFMIPILSLVILLYIFPEIALYIPQSVQ
ncbi:TRAP transporter large permease [Mesobacillus maritimus]|uniref:TRAP transporter large permease n=1 Tax=Mesobacillus maritimus TaxID=1643336 RepID=UPI00203E23D7|nr:TRAP transporter large permease [Mesobacillus maritimus]MCM3587860.1 TRAP transporter large permease [Mesobacillus maritimus]MCM3671789.1 TRAP transporter large permease [Mesobacillus maritimus]